MGLIKREEIEAEKEKKFHFKRTKSISWPQTELFLSSTAAEEVCVDQKVVLIKIYFLKIFKKGRTIADLDATEYTPARRVSN